MCDGNITLVGAPVKPLAVSGFDLIMGRRSLPGSPELSWGKRTQTPSPCPRPPSPLKPEMEQKDFVVSSSERILGAGQKHQAGMVPPFL
jgi:hypothetical protein